jgi:stearoyl-CoA desaturase (delta-9 desaturase)
LYERVLPNQCPTIPEAPPSHGETDTKPETLWVSFVFLVALHVAGLATVLYYAIVTPPTLAALGLCGVGFVATTFGISAGYHRLFSHGSYATGPVVKSVLLLLGAGAMQNSALEWARNHRLHHQYTDTDRDPYNAKRGFWYSHIKWVVEKTDHPDIDLSDLEADRVVSLQHRYYLPLAIVMAFVVPTLVGWFLGDAWGGLLLGGVVRLLLAYHATFSINSFAHWLGNQRYSSAHTARDSWWTALFTMGEGYHNFHHTFPGDYRNGVRFFECSAHPGARDRPTSLEASPRDLGAESTITRVRTPGVGFPGRPPQATVARLVQNFEFQSRGGRASRRRTRRPT